MSGHMSDITPGDSVVPIYLDTRTQVPLVGGPDEQIQGQVAARQAAVTKLMALGLTEEEALALVGG